MWGIFKRVTVCAAAATALAGATAGQASAMAMPVCAAKLAAPATGPTASCVFLESSSYAEINVEPVLTTVTATVRCFTSSGSTYTNSRTVSEHTTWFTWAPGSCNLELSSTSPTAAAIATASPWFPIVDPGPVI
jgi:hypothetical protein